ncbi:lipopolysaccharide biosynthesis protein [Clostridium massiliamazoniense]|uniref:lipopolysaccharide biosynthesis protein n=1 Tax=Clostridium massiliamazoniense TaxID=1347366 RepID=UPI0006D793BE|nr:polysaccharide biosynthesis C-terminal domain-containing protein [Clostridium massiliamazoniense]
MSKEKELIKNTLIYAVGNIGSKLLTFILIPIYTKYLKEADVGYFDIIVNTALLLLPMITFQISDGIYRFIIKTDDEKERKIIISNGYIIIIQNIALFTIGYILISIGFNVKNSILIYLYIITNLVYTVKGQVVRALKKTKEFAMAGFVVTLVSLLLNIVFITKFKMKTEGLLIAYIIAFFIGSIYLEWKGKILKYFSFEEANINEKRKLKKFSVPLIPNVISWWVMNLSDRYMIANFISNAANGVYSIANKFSSIIVIVNSFFSLAWQESAIVEYDSKDRDEYYTRMFNTYMKIQLGGAIVLIAFTKIVFKFLVKENFYVGYKAIPILYVASVFSAFSVFYGTGYQSANDTKGSFQTTILGAVLNITINIFAIPMWGIEGAAISTLVSYLVVWIVRIIQTKKYFSIKISKLELISLIIILLIFTVIYYVNNIVVEIIMFILSILIFVFFNKEIFIKVLNKIIKK